MKITEGNKAFVWALPYLSIVGATAYFTMVVITISFLEKHFGG
jgi:hypothetical protein